MARPFTLQRIAVVIIASLLLEARSYDEGSYYRRKLEARAHAWREIAFGIVELSDDIDLSDFGGAS